MGSISELTKSTWMDVTNESVHTSDDVDIGDIAAINRDFIVVKRGYIHVHYYYIPLGEVEGWDGHVVWLKIPEEEVKGNYERKEKPDPANYYTKDQPYGETTTFTTAYFPKMPIIETRDRTRPSAASKDSRNNPESPGIESEMEYRCILCGSYFRTEQDLNSHVSDIH